MKPLDPNPSNLQSGKVLFVFLAPLPYSKPIAFFSVIRKPVVISFIAVLKTLECATKPTIYIPDDSFWTILAILHCSPFEPR